MGESLTFQGGAVAPEQLVSGNLRGSTTIRTAPAGDRAVVLSSDDAPTVALPTGDPDEIDPGRVTTSSNGAGSEQLDVYGPTLLAGDFTQLSLGASAIAGGSALSLNTYSAPGTLTTGLALGGGFGLRLLTPNLPASLSPPAVQLLALGAAPIVGSYTGTWADGSGIVTDNSLPVLTAGAASYTTNASGDVTITWAEPFSAGLVSVHVTQHGGTTPYHLVPRSGGLTGVTVRVFTAAGVALGAGVAVPLSYLALGW